MDGIPQYAIRAFAEEWALARLRAGHGRARLRGKHRHSEQVRQGAKVRPDPRSTQAGNPLPPAARVG